MNEVNEASPANASERTLSDLLGCPFCGEAPRLVDLAGWEILCGCGVNMCLATPDQESLIKAWNTRAT